MKSVKRFAALLAVTAALASCKKAIDCDTPNIRRVVFYTNVSTYTIPDTTALLVKCNKGSGFSEVSEIYPPIYLTKIDNTKQLDFPDKGKDTYDYDWQITLKPSNRVYKLTKLEHESATSKTHHCTNTVSFKVNDSAVSVPGNPYSSTPYYTSDIQIEYL